MIVVSSSRSCSKQYDAHALLMGRSSLPANARCFAPSRTFLWFSASRSPRAATAALSSFCFFTAPISASIV